MSRVCRRCLPSSMAVGRCGQPARHAHGKSHSALAAAQDTLLLCGLPSSWHEARACWHEARACWHEAQACWHEARACWHEARACWAPGAQAAQHASSIWPQHLFDLAHARLCKEAHSCYNIAGQVWGPGGRGPPSPWLHLPRQCKNDVWRKEPHQCPGTITPTVCRTGLRMCLSVCVCVCDCVRGSPAGPRCWLAAALRSTPSCSCCASERAHCPTVCQTCPPLAHPALLLRTRANERVLRALGAPGAPLAFAHSLAILLVHLLACSLASLLAFVDLLARLLACMLAATPTPLAQGAEPTPMTTAHMCSCQVLNLPGAAPSTCACAARPPTCTVPGARLFLCLLPRFHVAQDAQQPLRSAAQHVGQDLQAPCAMCCSARVLVILRNPSAGAQGFRAPRQCFERSSESLMPCCPSV